MIKINNLIKTFNGSSGIKEVLDNVNISVEKGNITGIIGPSGVGKSTILNILVGLVKPEDGEVFVFGKDITKFNKKMLRSYRQDVGFVFQDYNLLNNVTVLNNIALPLKIKGVKKTIRLNKAKQALKYVNLIDEKNSYPSELSGGMKQRVAIARALIHEPKILLLDEITSSLDFETAMVIISLLKKINEDFKITILIASHDLLTIKKLCSDVYILKDGSITEHLTIDKQDKSMDFDYKKELGAILW